jgi:lipoprotein NlpI
MMDWDAGRYGEAARIFATPPKNNGVRIDIALWRAVALASENQDYKDELHAEMAKPNSMAWPAAIANLYLGMVDPGSVLAAAKAFDPQQQPGAICEAEFYVGEWYALAHNNAAAIPLLQDAANICPSTFFGKTGAAAELRRLQ